MIKETIKKEFEILSVNKVQRNCLVCGDKFDYDKKIDALNGVPDNMLCSTCRFWEEKVSDRDNEHIARINGEHYYIGEENQKYKGMAGIKHTIKFNDSGS